MYHDSWKKFFNPFRGMVASLSIKYRFIDDNYGIYSYDFIGYIAGFAVQGKYWKRKGKFKGKTFYIP